MGETPNQRAKRDTGSRQREMCSSAPDRTIYGGHCRDLTDQPDCELETLIGWEPHTRTHARTNGLSRTCYFDIADACGLSLVVCVSFLEGSSGMETP